MNTVRRNLRPLATMSLAVLLPTLAAAQVNTGSADLSRYVAIGDSYGAGVVNGSIHEDAQINSYPALISRQARGIAGGFEQPLVSDPGIPGVLQLRGLSPLVIAPKPGLGQPINLTLPRPYDNLSVPGADTTDVLNTITDNGGGHDLVLRGIGTQLQQALALQPTFVSVWIGGNDALGAVLSGRVIDNITLTTLSRFETNYRTLVGTLVGAVPGVVIGTLPSAIEGFPFAATIPPVVVDPTTGEPVVIGGSTVPLIGPEGPMGPGDFVLLTASPLLARGIGIPAALGGTDRPLPDDVTLLASEVATILSRVAGYNDIIRTAARDFDVALAEIDGRFEEWSTDGSLIGGIEFTTDFLTGGLFGLDGFHLSPIGYALFANEFIVAINQKFNAAIPMVDLADFLFGDAGAYPGGTALPFSAASVRLTRKAIKNMRFLMGVPSPKQLRRLARQQ